MSPRTPIDALAAVRPDFDDDDVAALSLRQQAVADPIPGTPLIVRGHAGAEDQQIAPGKWREASYYDLKTALPLNCPVVPLGQGGENGDLFFFLNTKGIVSKLPPNAGKGHIDALFAGRPNFLRWAWPQWKAPKDDEGEWVVSNWAAETARTDLFAACAYKDVFEAFGRVRGRGAWRGTDGSLVYHAGDAVWLHGAWRKPGEYGEQIYPGRPRICRPAKAAIAAAPDAGGDLALQAFMGWNWDRPVDPYFALGWIMTALVGGALRQRPVIWVVGGEGTGKSTLQEFIKHLLGGALVEAADSTGAGVYQVVRQDSVPVILDEQEAEPDPRRNAALIKLARLAYSGAKMNRGGEDGTPKEYALYSSFYFTSIVQPGMGAADASRMATLMLRPLSEREEPERNVLAELGLNVDRAANALGAVLLRRMFSWFELKGMETRWDQLFGVWRKFLMSIGHEARSADAFGGLAAAAHAALHDDMPTDADFAVWHPWLAPAELYETSSREESWKRCFWHLLEARPDALRHATYHSLADAIQPFQRRGMPEALGKLEDTAQALGLAISFPKGCAATWASARLFVPIKHPALNELFKDTQWAGQAGAPGPWAGALRQMPKAHCQWPATCDKGLNRAAKGLLINLSALIGDAEEQKEAA